ncbi:MAG: ATP-binding protein [Longimicrobiales bacterium]
MSSQIPFVGHEALRAALATANLGAGLPGTLLIHGPPGCGKQTLAHWLAQLRLCENNTGGPCGTCRSCRFVERLEHPDVHWYFPLPRPKGAGTPERLARALETARHERLAQHRGQPLRPHGDQDVKGLYLAQVRSVRKAAQKRPTIGNEQVFIIGDAEYLVPQEASPAAANALLKLLEEPPEGSRFILTSSRPESLLETIRSRALSIHLPPLPEDEVAHFLETHASVPPDAARRSARLGRGSIGVALGYLDESGSLTERRAEALTLLKAAVAGSKEEIYSTSASYGPAGARGLLGLLADLQEWIRDLSAEALDAEDHVGDRDSGPFLQATAGRLAITPNVAARAVERVEEARILAEANVNPQLLISSLLLDLEAAFLGGPKA